MFLCDKCLEKDGVDTSYLVFPSFGPCEDCKKLKPCIDYKIDKKDVDVRDNIPDSERSKAWKCNGCGLNWFYAGYFECPSKCECGHEHFIKLYKRRGE